MVAETNNRGSPGPAGLLARHRGFLLALLDALVVGATFVLAYYLRFHLRFLAIKEVPVADEVLYLRGAAVLASLWVFFIWREGGYVSDLRGVGSLMVRYRTLVRSGIFAMAALMSISFLYRESLLLSRQVYLMTAVIACAAMATFRLALRGLDRWQAARGRAAHQVVFLGAGAELEEILRRLERHAATINIVGVVGWEAAEGSGVDLPHLGHLEQIAAIHAATPFNTLIACSPEGARERGQLPQAILLGLINFCEGQGVATYLSPSSFDVAVTQQEVGSLSGLPLIRIQDAGIGPGSMAVKRTVDLVLGLALLLVTLPLWGLIALLIRLTSPGPVLYRQERAGLHGQPFQMFKFRSMVAGAAAQRDALVDLESLPEPVFKLQDDPRVTPLGRFLRRFGLDELPQLWNVLRGEMSLVGPRPEELDLVVRYDPWQRRRLKALPGITGYQQIMNRGSTSLAERVRYDLIYLKHQSLLFDCYILARTVDVVLRGRGISH